MKEKVEERNKGMTKQLVNNDQNGNSKSLSIKIQSESMLAHTCIPNTQRLMQKGHEFKASLDYITILCLNKQTKTRKTKTKSIECLNG
jgi:hypothetical protein